MRVTSETASFTSVVLRKEETVQDPTVGVKPVKATFLNMMNPWTSSYPETCQVVSCTPNGILNQAPVSTENFLSVVFPKVNFRLSTSWTQVGPAVKFTNAVQFVGRELATKISSG